MKMIGSRRLHVWVTLTDRLLPFSFQVVSNNAPLSNKNFPLNNEVSFVQQSAKVFLYMMPQSLLKVPNISPKRERTKAHFNRQRCLYTAYVARSSRHNFTLTNNVYA